MRKGQAAMEFLMSYGWVIIVALAIIGALHYFGMLSPDKILPDKCTVQLPFVCIDAKVYGGSNSDNVLVLLRPGGVGIEQYSIGLICDGGVAGTPGSGATGAMLDESTTHVNFTCPTPLGGTRWKGLFNISYTKAGEAVSHVAVGSLEVKAE